MVPLVQLAISGLAVGILVAAFYSRGRPGYRKWMMNPIVALGFGTMICSRYAMNIRDPLDWIFLGSTLAMVVLSTWQIWKATGDPSYQG
jgi:hypothetical protein